MNVGIIPRPLLIKTHMFVTVTQISLVSGRRVKLSRHIRLRKCGDSQEERRPLLQ